MWRHLPRIFERRTAISAGVGALLILVLTSALIANAALQSSPAPRAVTRGNVGAASSPTSAAPHVTFSLTPTAGATGTPIARPTPQSDPTAGSGGHHVDPGSSGNPGSGSGSPTPTPTAVPTAPPAPGATPPGATPPAGPPPSPSPTPVSAPAGSDAAAVGPVEPTTPPSTAGATVFVTVQNTGTTTWLDDGTFYFGCESDCAWNASGLPRPSFPVVPGAQVSFSIQVVPDTFSWTRTVHHSHWRMAYRQLGVPSVPATFGQDMVLSLYETGEAPVIQQSAPTCDSTSGVSWDVLNSGSGNTIVCTPQGLRMSQGTSSHPQINLLTVSGYDPSNYHMHVHVHFDDASTSDFAAVATHLSARNGCGGTRLEVRPDGEYRVFEYVRFVNQTNCTESTWFQGTMPAATDYDLLVVVWPGEDLWFINGFFLNSNGADIPAGPPGLEVIGAGTGAASIYFSQFEIDTPVGVTLQYQLQGV